jgi:hypothetical protein
MAIEAKNVQTQYIPIYPVPEGMVLPDGTMESERKYAIGKL